MIAAAAERPLKLLHVISGLGIGGAQTMLLNLALALQPHGWRSEVVGLTADGPMSARLRASGIATRALKMSRSGWPRPDRVFRLARWLRREPPDLIQSWMYHADLTAGLAAVLAGKPPVVWGLQHVLDPPVIRPRTYLVARGCARLSRVLPARIIACSNRSVAAHRDLGYERDKMVHIPNGFRTDCYIPSEADRRSLRAELGLAPDALLVGMAARFHPQKDHSTFLRAAAKIAGKTPGAHFVLCGAGVDPANPELTGLVSQLQLAGRVHLLGLRDDMPRVTAALDVVAFTPRSGDAFPLSLGEAMSCGVPCVVTDVGDAADIVGETGRVVAPRRPEEVASACCELLQMPGAERQALGLSARDRIESRYRIEAIALAYNQLYQEVLAEPRSSRHRSRYA